ncbi:MAG: hypothetical protein HC927_05445 [Deltaproteobacteria bacterium]|nr:hypothetical protein [Deltaproteobacteria bacterium]
MDEDKKYKTFTIPKRSGGRRQILAPCGPILGLQHKLRDFLDACYEPPPSTHGYVPGRSIRTNAVPHEKCQYMMKLDIVDFFPSITFARVYGLFKAAPFRFTNKVASTLANLLCYREVLPQGAPTSPVVSNLICQRLDRDLLKFAREYSSQFTRYADDLTFSTKDGAQWGLVVLNDKRKCPHPEIERIIQENGFRLNEAKTRFLNKYCRRIVTGVVTNERLNVPQSYLRTTNRMLKLAGTNGLDNVGRWYCQDNHIFSSTVMNFADYVVKVLQGRIAYAKMIRGSDDPICQKHSIYLDNIVSGRPLTYGAGNYMKFAKLTPLRVLHLSDFHFRVETSWNATPLLEDLVNCIGDPARMSLLPPDLVVVTGDIAFSGRKAEYALAADFLSQLCARISLPINRVFMVPGNHDVDRAAVSDVALREQKDLLKLDEPGARISAMFKDADIRRVLLRRLDSYVDFCKNFYGSGLRAEPWWKETVQVRDMNIGISGLCSSWMSVSDGEQGQLMLGLPQVNEVMHRGFTHDLTMTLLHHPLNWISEKDAESVDEIRAWSDVVFHGHVHTSDIATTYSQCRGDDDIGSRSGVRW